MYTQNLSAPMQNKFAVADSFDKQEISKQYFKALT